MTDDLYIDGRNACETWGVYVTDGGYKELAGFPPLKEPEKNDWWEDDGEEADLSAPRLDTREVTLKTACCGGDMDGFLAFLNKGAYHTVTSKALGRSWNLRYTKQASLEYCGGLYVLALKFAEDDPLAGYVYAAPSGASPGSTGFSLDGKDLADYGVHILSGSLASVLAVPEVKSNLLRNIKSLQGAQYDGKKVRYKSKEIRLSCLMRAADMAELWRNRDALLYDLTRPGARTLGVDALGRAFECHYSKSTVEEFLADGRPWLKFSLNLTAIGGLRSELVEVYLAAENGSYIVSEEGNYITIDILDNGRE